MQLKKSEPALAEYRYWDCSIGACSQEADEPVATSDTAVHTAEVARRKLTSLWPRARRLSRKLCRLPSA